MAFEKELPQWKEKGVKPPQSKLDEGWKVQDKPPAAWLNWQMNKTYEALKEVQEKAAEKTEVSTAIEDTKKYTDQKVAGIDLTKITPGSIGAVKKEDFDAHSVDKTKHITVDERKAWNEAKSKADNALPLTGGYVQGFLGATGNMECGGFDFKLGSSDQISRGNSGTSRALVKNADSVLAINYGGDFTGGVNVQGPHLTVENRLIVQGKDVISEIDSVKQSGVNAKQQIVDSLNAIAIVASTNEDWATLAAKLRQAAVVKSAYVSNTREVRTNSVDRFNFFDMPAGTTKVNFTADDEWNTSLYESSNYYNGTDMAFVVRDAYGNECYVGSSYRGQTMYLYSFMIDTQSNNARYSYFDGDNNKRVSVINKAANLNPSGGLSFGTYIAGTGNAVTARVAGLLTYA